MNSVKQTILEKAKDQVKTVFKSSTSDNLSLTLDGFNFCKDHIYEEVFTMKTGPITTKEVLLLSKVFTDTPYYYDPKKKLVHHFDEPMALQNWMYGVEDFRKFLESFI